jgi:hypothetical protein
MSNISANQDLFVDLKEKEAQTISGGLEVFTIQNATNYSLDYTVDSTLFTHYPGEVWVYDAYSGGIIEFDEDTRWNVKNFKKYDLANGAIYEFQNNPTPGNPYDIDLYSIA